MNRAPFTVPVGQFKARCLALLDQVAETGEPVVVTRRGRPVARLLPVEDADLQPLRGSVLRETDLVSPIEAPLVTEPAETPREPFPCGD